MYHKRASYQETISPKFSFFKVFQPKPEVKFPSQNYEDIRKILKKTLGDNLHSWEGQHHLLHTIANQIGTKTAKPWLGKVVADLLIDTNFTLNNLEKALEILDQLYLNFAAEKRFLASDSLPTKLTAAHRIYHFLYSKNLQNQRPNQEITSLTYMDMLTAWQQKARITKCFQLHRLLATGLEMFEIPTAALHLQIFYDGRKKWHEQTLIYPEQNSKIFDLSLGENYQQADHYREFLVDSFNFAELLQYRLNYYYNNKYYQLDPLQGIQFINSLDLLANKKSNLGFLYTRNVFYAEIILNSDQAPIQPHLLIKEAIQNAQLIWQSFQKYPSFIPEENDYLSLMQVFLSYINKLPPANKVPFDNFAQEIKREAVTVYRQISTQN